MSRIDSSTQKEKFTIKSSNGHEVALHGISTWQKKTTRRVAHDESDDFADMQVLAPQNTGRIFVSIKIPILKTRIIPKFHFQLLSRLQFQPFSQVQIKIQGQLCCGRSIVTYRSRLALSSRNILFR